MVRKAISLPSRPVSGTITSTPSGIQVVTIVPGTPLYFDASGTSVPGTFVDLISVTVPVGRIYYVSQVNVACNIGGKFTVEVDGSKIGSGHTGSGRNSGVLPWIAPRAVTAGKEIKVRFRAFSWGPTAASADTDAYLIIGDSS